MLWSASAVAGPSIYPTGVTRYDPGKAYNVFVLFTGADQKTHPIDMDGEEVHRWDHGAFPSGLLDPTVAGGERGHVIVWLSVMTDGQTPPIPGLPVAYRNKTIGELDWNGKVVWQWGENAPSGGAQQHHDWSRSPNGDTLVLSSVIRSIRGFTLSNLIDAAIYEVTPECDIAWKWIAGDHLDEFGFTPEALAMVQIGRAHV